jgi:RNA polymerase sigma-70 factor, ECF subfamily
MRVSSPVSLLRSRGASPKERSTPPQSPTDSELASLARDKDPRAATLIWDRYAGLVRGVLHRSLGPGHEVEDLLQDVFIGFFKSVVSLRETASLRPFLVGIAVRTALTELRKRRVRRWLRLSADGVLPDVPAADSDPRAKEAVRRLYAVLHDLSDRERMAFVLRHAEGHELTETAALLGVSLATVKRVLQRAERLVEARAREDDLLCAWTERRDE